MAIISIHHGEQEWEGDYAEGGWIDFLVGGHIVHVADELMKPRDVVLLEVSWWLDLVLLVLVRPPPVELCGVEVREMLFDVCLLLNWGPHEANVGRRSALHHIESMVDSLLLGHEPHIDLESAHVVLVTLVHAVHLV